MSGKVTLVKYIHDPEKRTWSSTYLVSHTSRRLRTTLEQHVTFNANAYGSSIPAIEMDEFPTDLEEREAMLKLADWLQRIAVALEDHWSTP
ncbi:hypothetical protein [Lonsdalea quercina]|uniref:hypothetical protein n=1 Tax=Lonsdalea quercina TaxID=71657 RepID=UPI003974B070